MPTLSQLVPLVLWGLFVLSAYIMLKTWKKGKPVKPWVIIMGQAASLGSFIVFSYFTHRQFNNLHYLIFVAFFIMGVIYGSFVRVQKTSKGIVMNYTRPYLIIWFTILALTQLITLLNKSVPALALLLSIANLGIAFGLNLRIINRYRRVQAVSVVFCILSLTAFTGQVVMAANNDELNKLKQNLFFQSYWTGTDFISGVGSDASVLLPSLGEIGYPADGVIKGSWRSISGYPCLDFTALRQLGGTSTTRIDLVNGDKADGLTMKGSIVWGVSNSSSGEPPDKENTWNWRKEKVSGYPGLTLYIREVLPQPDRGIMYAVYYVYYGQIGNMWVDVESSCQTLKINDRPNNYSTGSPAYVKTAPLALLQTMATKSGSLKSGTKIGDSSSSSNTLQNSDVMDFGDTPVSDQDASSAVNYSSIILIISNLISVIMNTKKPGLPSNLGSTLSGGGSNQPPTGGGSGSIELERIKDGEAPGSEGSNASKPSQGSVDARGRIYTDAYGWVDRNTTSKEIERLRQARGRNLEALKLAERSGNTHDVELLKGGLNLIDAKSKQQLTIFDSANRHFDEKKQDLLDEIEASQNKSEQLASRSKFLDRAGNTLDMVKFTADISMGILEICTGPVGRIVGKGYFLTSGLAGGMGQSMAGQGNLVSNLAWGGAEGAFNAYGMEALSGSFSAVRKFVGNKGTALLDEELQAVKNALDEALTSKDPTKIRNLYMEHGMEKMARLEQSGGISREGAQFCNQVVTKDVNQAMEQATQSSMQEWNQSRKVKVKEILLGDSGSSSKSGTLRSIKTDADRTVVITFEEEGLREYAGKKGINLEQAHKELSEEFVHNQGLVVESNLAEKGLTSEALDAKLYNGMGAGAGHLDAYEGGYPETRMFVEGESSSYTMTKSGGVRVTDISGQALVDQDKLNRFSLTWDRTILQQPSIKPSDMNSMVEQNYYSLLKNPEGHLAKDTAKAIDRLQYVAGRVRKNLDPNIVKIATAIRADPQNASAILNAHGTTANQFYQQAKGSADDFVAKFGQLYNAK